MASSWRRYSAALAVLVAAVAAVLPSTVGSFPVTRERLEAGAGSTTTMDPGPARLDSAAASRSEAAVQYHITAGDTPVAPPPETFAAPAPRPTPPPAVLTQPPASATRPGGTWAVVIGINDYPGNSADLRSGVNDAADVSQALLHLGVPAENVLVLLDAQATADVIRSSLRWLTDRAGPDATAVFFYAGHIRKLRPHTEAIVGADGGVVTDDEVGRRLQGLQARRAWIALAACYAGGFQEVLAPGRILTAAADADDLAYENSSFGRSYLVQYMIRQGILEGRASQHVQAAFAYAQAAIHRDYPGREPVQYDHSDGAMDLRPPEPEPAPPPQPRRESPPPTSPPTTQPPARQPASSPEPPKKERCLKVGIQWCR